MAAPSGSSGNMPTTVYSNVWTHTTHFIMFIAATVASASPTSTLTSRPSFQSSPSASTSSLAFLMVTNASVLMTSAGPTSASDGSAPNESNISSSLSEEERRRYWDWLQEETTLKLIPTVLFLATLSVVGLIGNTMVLLVYSKKANRSATDIFIMAMASCDAVANVLGIPSEIHDLLYFWDLKEPLECKLRAFVSTMTTLTSAQILLAVAVSRYKKICRPFGKQISRKNAKIISILIAFMYSLVAIPNAMLYGQQTTTLKPGIIGRQCFTDDKYIDTIWPKLYAGLLAVLFFGCCIPLIVLYVLIGLQAWRHSTIHGIPTTQSTPVASVDITSDTVDSTDDTDGKTDVSRFFRPKNKKKINNARGNSSDDQETGNEKRAKLTGKPTNVEEQRLSRKKEKRTVDKVDDHCADKIRSPMEVKSPVDSSMIEELSLQLLKYKDINRYEKRDGHIEAGKLKTEALCERTSPQEFLNAHDNISQKPKDGAENDHKEMSDGKHVGGYCLNENKKTEEENDVADDGTYRKNTSQSGTVSGHKSLHLKLDDTLTLTGISEARPSNTAVSEMENPPKKDMTYLTLPETEGDVENRKRFKNCGRKGPLNDKFNYKSGKSKGNVQRRGLTRTTLMLFIISVIYVMAFVPYLVLMTCKFTVPNFMENMSAVGFAIYHLFQRTYFINSAANAVIYSLCDKRFRNEAKKIMRCKT